LLTFFAGRAGKKFIFLFTKKKNKVGSEKKREGISAKKNARVKKKWLVFAIFLADWEGEKKWFKGSVVGSCEGLTGLTGFNKV